MRNGSLWLLLKDRGIDGQDAGFAAFGWILERQVVGAATGTSVWG